MRSNVLFSSPGVTVMDVWCDPGPNPPSDVEIEPEFAISIPRAGMYVHRMTEGDLFVDPSVMVLRNRGEEQVTVHPTNSGDHNTDIQFSHELVEPLLDGGGRFRSRLYATNPGLALKHHQLLVTCRSATGNALEIEESALRLLAVSAGFESPTETPPRHRTIVDETRQLLATRFRDDLDLVTIARIIGMSPFHLSRVFHTAVGRTMHSYRTHLRVQWVIEALSQGAPDLSVVAIEAGFSDHSHMTRVFRSLVGATPSWVRSTIGTQ
jgi:AraC-like DNA-binding protein